MAKKAQASRSRGVLSVVAPGDEPAPCARWRPSSSWPRVSSAPLYWGTRADRAAGHSGRGPAAERAAGHDRHAARRCPGLGRRTGADAQHRCDCRGWRPLFVRPRPGGRDAAVAREHPHRHLPVSARLPGKQRLPAEAGDADAGDDPEGARLRDGCVRGRLPARRTVRADAGVRRLRRALRRSHRRWLHDCRAAGVSGRRAGHVVDRRAGRRALARLGPRLRAARALSATAALRSRVCGSTVFRRSGGGRRRARSTVRVCAPQRAADARGHYRRSRRSARRSRRVHARVVRLRVHAAHPADHGGRWHGRTHTHAKPRRRQPLAMAGRDPPAKSPTTRRGTSTSCRRSSMRCRSTSRRRCRDIRSGRAPIAAPAEASLRISKRCRRCSITDGRRSPVCCQDARSSSTRRSPSCTTLPSIRTNGPI